MHWFNRVRILTNPAPHVGLDSHPPAPNTPTGWEGLSSKKRRKSTTEVTVWQTLFLVGGWLWKPFYAISKVKPTSPNWGKQSYQKLKTTHYLWPCRVMIYDFIDVLDYTDVGRREV